MRKDWIVRELTSEIIVGVFMVMVLFGLGYFTIILSREAWFTEKYEMEVVFSHTMGLRDGDSVVVRGMPIGRVKRLDLMEDGVHAHLLLDQGLHLREDCSAAVVASSVLGGRYLEIDEGTTNALPLGRGVVLQGEEPVDLVADASELVSTIKQSILEGGVLDDLKDSIEILHSTAKRIDEGKGTLGLLLSEDDKVYRDVAATIASIRKIGDRLEGGEGSLGRLLSEDDRMYEDLAAAAASLRRVTEQIEKSEGVVGRLVRDDGLYQELEDAIRELRAWIDDSRETSPVVSFTSILFGAF